MIKKLLHSIFSITMAFMVLFSTVSFTVEKHYCGDVLVDVSVFDQLEKCGMEQNVSEMPGISKKSCCKDTIDLVQGQDELNFKTFDELNFEQQLFITGFAVSYLKLLERLPEQIIPHRYYSPPKLITDIQVRDQVFII